MALALSLSCSCKHPVQHCRFDSVPDGAAVQTGQPAAQEALRPGRPFAAMPRPRDIGHDRAGQGERMTADTASSATPIGGAASVVAALAVSGHPVLSHRADLLHCCVVTCVALPHGQVVLHCLDDVALRTAGACWLSHAGALPSPFILTMLLSAHRRRHDS